jgi:hypothetical protein
MTFLFSLKTGGRTDQLKKEPIGSLEND